MEPVYRRKFLSFISHSHSDKKIVNHIVSWLTDIAGIPIWYDDRYLPVGAKVASDLGTSIEQCQSMIIVLSKESIKSGWVKEEYDAGIEQRAQSRGEFRIIPIRIEECEIPTFLRSTKWLDVLDGKLTLSTAHQLLLSLYQLDTNFDIGKHLDIYISRSWRNNPETEPVLANAVCGYLDKAGFRLIGDSEDQKGFGEGNRVETIVSSCGGLVAILPDRGGGKTSKYMIQEVEFARNMKLPYLIVMEDTITLPEEIVENALEVVPIAKDTIEEHGTIGEMVSPIIEILKEKWKNPPKSHYVFYGTDFDVENVKRNQIARRVVEQVTAMPCIMGEDIRKGQIQETIVKQIVNAFVVIADISDDNINTCIEAGIARGASIPSHLIAKSPRQRPPFMFRDQQVWHYSNDVELLGVIHDIVRDYRRRIINYEL